MTDPATSSPTPEQRQPRDQGTAMIITLMVMTLVATLAATVTTVTVDNLTNTRRAQDSAMALDAADAGVTQAVTYLRSSGTRGLDCSPGCGAANPWGSSASPMSQSVAGTTAQRYATWISKPMPYPTGRPGARVATITSEGRSGQGVRRIAVDVVISLGESQLPLGVFARTITGSGGGTFTNISAFSTGCVWGRRRMTMTGEDPVYGMKAAVHAARVITPANGSGSGCSASSGSGANAPIHASTDCSSEFPYDQDSLGGPCSTPNLASLYPAYYSARELDGNVANGPDVSGTFIRDAASLSTLFGINDDPLPPAKLEQLKHLARSQVDGSHSNYYTSATGWSVPDPTKHPHSVLYFDLTATNPGGLIDLKDLGNTWSQPTAAVTSDCKDRSLLVVIAGGNVRLNSDFGVSASIVLTSKTYGEVNKANGSADLTGTIFANNLDLAGNINFKLDSCFMANLSPHLTSADLVNYRELDRG